MSKEENIRKGFLADKMAGFTPEPPEALWTSINSQINEGKRGRGLIIFLAVAAGLALALTVGIALFTDRTVEDIAEDPVIIEESKILNEAPKDEAKAIGPESTMPLQVTEKNVPKPVSSKREKPYSLKEKVILALEEELEDKEDTGQNFAETNVGKILPAAVDTSESNIFEASAHSVQEQDSLLKLLVSDEIQELIPEEKTNSGKWQLGASLAPQYSYRDVASLDASQNRDANSSESGKLTYSGGVQVNYTPSGRLTIESGLFYNRMGVNIGEYSNFMDGRMSAAVEFAEPRAGNVVSISNSMGTVVADDKSLFVNNYSENDAVADYHLLTPKALTYNDAAVNGFSQTFEFIEIPVNVKYTIIDREFKIQLIGGMSTNLLINNSLSASTNNGTEQIGEFTDLHAFNYSGNAGIGFIYDFAKNFSLSIEPRFRYYLNSINISYLPTTRPYTFGLQTGVNYTF